MSSNHYNIHNNHQIIPRQQNYLLDRKILTVHSTDRDIKKWKFGNTFEIDLPESMNHVQSMRLVETSMPTFFTNFSNEYQNTKLQFRVKAILDTSDPSATLMYSALASNYGNYYEITVPDGFYTSVELTNTVTALMNKAVTDYLQTIGATVGMEYTYFTIYNDTVGFKFYIGNTHDDFILGFDKKSQYTLKQCEQPDVFGQYTNWGLPFHLGFDKQTYTTQSTTDGLDFLYNSPGLTKWLVPDPGPATPTSYYVEASNVYKLFGDDTIYMEVDKYNSMDELVPYSEATNNMYNNDYNGTVNSAFAKIPVTAQGYIRTFESRNSFLTNVSHYEPTIERIQKLKFKFRTHDGRLIDFQGVPFNFTIEFNMLKNEISKNYSVRVPGMYSL